MPLMQMKNGLHFFEKAGGRFSLWMQEEKIVSGPPKFRKRRIADPGEARTLLAASVLQLNFAFCESAARRFHAIPGWPVVKNADGTVGGQVVRQAA
jgi:hypothetical protein